MAAFASKHKCVVASSMVGALFRPHWFLLLETRLFQAKTDAFNAPIRPPIRARFRCLAISSVVGEDMVQLALMASVQASLSGWTPLNALSFGVSEHSSVVSVISLAYKITRKTAEPRPDLSTCTETRSIFFEKPFFRIY